MRNRMTSYLTFLFFNAITLSLIFATILYRTDIIVAQSNTEDSDSAAVLPRETQIDDGEDDDEGNADGDDGPEILTYVVKPGDTLFRIARMLGVSYQSLATQADNPSLIHAGQKFTYSPENSGGASAAPANNNEVNTAPHEDESGLNTYTFTVRPGDTLSHIAAYLGVSLAELAEQTENPARIHPGQKFTYISDQRIDTPPLFTDNDGTDSDGIDTTGQFTDNDGTDSDGIDTTGQWTDNDGTDSDGIDTTGQWTDNDGTDSDDIDTQAPTPQSPPDSDDTDDSGLSS